MYCTDYMAMTKTKYHPTAESNTNNFSLIIFGSMPFVSENIWADYVVC
jgi:hypothetical protein